MVRAAAAKSRGKGGDAGRGSGGGKAGKKEKELRDDEQQTGSKRQKPDNTGPKPETKTPPAPTLDQLFGLPSQASTADGVPPTAAAQPDESPATLQNAAMRRAKSSLDLSISDDADLDAAIADLMDEDSAQSEARTGVCPDAGHGSRSPTLSWGAGGEGRVLVKTFTSYLVVARIVTLVLRFEILVTTYMNSAASIVSC
mgnify:CR=1 FL=1